MAAVRKDKQRTRGAWVLPRRDGYRLPSSVYLASMRWDTLLSQAILFGRLTARDECQPAGSESFARSRVTSQSAFSSPGRDELWTGAQFSPDGPRRTKSPVVISSCATGGMVMRVRGKVMVDRAIQEPGWVISFPAFFLVRLPEVHDAAAVVRNTLRLGSKGVTVSRQWFMPVFTTEEGASRFAAEVRKIDDKLRLIAIQNFREWVSLLQALRANGDAYVAFDPQASFVQHVAITDLIACARKFLSDNPRADSNPRSSEPDVSRSWLRSRLAALLPTSGTDGRARAEGGREGSGTPPGDTEDRKSTRLNSSHLGISYAVSCL